MNKLTILTALTALSMSSFAFAEDMPTAKPTLEKLTQKVEKVTGQAENIRANAQKQKVTGQAPTAKADRTFGKKDATQKVGQFAKKGTGSLSMKRFENIDKDSNKNISQAEFTASQTAAFNKKDKNKDGNLSPAEFSPTLAKMQTARN